MSASRACLTSHFYMCETSANGAKSWPYLAAPADKRKSPETKLWRVFSVALVKKSGAAPWRVADVVGSHEGVCRGEKIDDLGPVNTLQMFEKVASRLENGSLAHVDHESLGVQVASNRGRDDFDAEKTAATRPSQPEINLDGSQATQKPAATTSRLGSTWPDLKTLAVQRLARIGEQPMAVLADDVYFELLQAVRVRWGSHLARLAGEDLALDAAIAADYLAADMAFVGWMRAARDASQGQDAVYLVERIAARRTLIAPLVLALMGELAGHHEAWAKAEAIADGPGWPEDKHAVIDARLHYLAERIQTITEAIEHVGARAPRRAA